MNIIRYPERLEWNFLLKRSALQTESLRETVCEILEKVRTQGDRAVIGYEEQFDKVKLNSLEVTEKEFEEAEKEVDIKLKAAIMLALNNIQTFHSSQKVCKQKNRNTSRSNLLAESRCHRKSRTLRTRRHGSLIFNSTDACRSGTNSRLQGNHFVYPSQP